MNSYDVIFVGSGHACWHGALLLKMAGKRVALVERELLGGTCTNYGCDAKILLDSPIELQEAFDRYAGIGLGQRAQVDWPSLMQYKKAVIGTMPDALGGLFASLGMDILRGEAVFVDSNTIEVGHERYQAKKFVIGTGQTYVPLEVPGKEYIHDSRDFLSLDDIPAHVTFLGGGIISLEFASVCLSLGRQVDVITHGGRLLSAYPQDYVNKVKEKMEGQGANFLFHTDIESVTRKPEGGYEIKGTNGLSLSTDYVLAAVGRKANAQGMNLEGIGVTFSRKGIVVDNHMRTSVKHIYASGDVVDKAVPKLTPTAEFESNYIAMDILNPFNAPIRYPAIPNLVFTLPRIAQTGVSVDEARQNPAAYRVEEVALGETMAWMNKANRDEHVTYVFDKKNRLVGAAVYSDEAGSYIDVLTIIIQQKLGIRELSRMIFSFPTPTYGLISSLLPLFLKKQAK